ncbi:hypothetical protein [Schlesneria sp. T3-172]|uniref:hypothetical protein n=1 Tax=Schlesneria sphaerica TaxID=3373610 RepID=UPI0037C55D30
MLITRPVFVSFTPAPAKQHTPETPRARRKRELLEANPTCKGCGLHLTDVSLRDDSAHLVGDTLSCQNCIGKIRRRNGLDIASIRPELTTKGQAQVNRFRYEKQQDQLKARLMAENPACCRCGKWLETAITENQAHLIVDRLACRTCRRAVRETIKAEADNTKAGEA